MEKDVYGEDGKGSGRLSRWADGKLYFSRQSERRFFFILTVLMLLAGIGYRLGLF